MSPRRPRRRTPYWNFWRVVLAGWWIRYPKTMFMAVFTPIGLLAALIYNAVAN